ncbi:hypothetical protein U1737_00015 [Sphingomonas sp. LB3N6]|uniref:hypothetical protein n=1 Tax=Sphingomonas fucosidasi TaxID=3096164 RepID=UPI002FC62CD7
MTREEWERKAAALAAEHAERSAATLDTIRLSLVELDRLFKEASTAIERRYKEIPERLLREFTEEAEALIDEGSLAWLQRDVVEAAAAQVRALDRHLYQHRERRGKPDDVNTDFLCTEHETHVIPRPLAKPPEDPAGVSTTTYRRRGLVRHRLLPRVTSEGFEVVLHWHRDLSLQFRTAEAKVVSAVFQDLTLIPDRSFEKFVASEAPCLDEDGAIDAQIAAVYEPGVVLALWPELTMPKERRAKLAGALLAKSKASPLEVRPAIIAAGSWHEVDGRQVRNRMHVLSGSGRHRFYHDKSLPLESTTLGVEELTPSDQVAVLVNDDVLIAFGICRDFCEAQISDLYIELDVDLVVVPSYGDRKTIEAHREKARRLSIKSAGSTFVVQQVVPEEVLTSGSAYVLPPGGKLDHADVGKLVVNEIAKAHPISFKKV